MSEARITLGVQSGDPESSEAMRPAFMSLRKQLAAFCTDSYSPSIQEFAIVIRICGSVWRFEGEGVGKIRVSRKEAYVTAEYIVPESRWKGVPFDEINKYLAGAVAETLQAMCERLVKSKMVVDTTKLYEDVDKATAAFLRANS